MTVPRHAVGAAVLLALIGIAGAGHADELNIYLVLSCDAVTNRALLRFGYADDTDPPVFPPLPGAAADDLSRWPVPQLPSAGNVHDRAQEISCRLGDGPELKARFGFGPSSSYGVVRNSRWKFSVWLGERKIFSSAPIEPPGCGDCSVHSILFEHDTARRCDFHDAREENLLHLAAKPAPIVCGTAVAATGTPDPIEYSPPGAPSRPRPGTMLITTNADDTLCRALIYDEAKHPYAQDEWRDIPNDVPLGEEVVSLRGVGGAFAGYEPVSAPGAYNGRVEAADLDFANDGKPRRVYHITGGNTYFNGDLFVATDAGMPEAPIMALVGHELSPSGDVEKIVALSSAHGWFAVTGEQTPYQSIRYTHIWLFRFDGSIYLLAVAPDFGDPTAVVLQPVAHNQLRMACVFQTVRPNF